MHSHFWQWIVGVHISTKASENMYTIACVDDIWQGPSLTNMAYIIVTII